MKPLLIVPARANSTRIPNKNLRPILGLSPYRRAIICCKQLAGAEIVVTADFHPKDELVDGVFYYRRPAALATDAASMTDVVLDALAYRPGPPDQPILVVQPTQPLRQPHHLLKALSILVHASSVCSVVESVSVDKLYRIVDRRLVPCGAGTERDQDGSRTYACDGTVYGFRRGWFLTHRDFRHPQDTVAFVVPADETCRLDTELDWAIASLRLQAATSVA